MNSSLNFRKKKVIVFDLDGTIVKLDANWHNLKDILAEKYFEDFQQECHPNRITTYLNEVVKKDNEERLKHYFEIIRKFELENIENADPIEETVYFIKYPELFGLDNKIKIAILSLNTRKTILEALKIAKINDKIDFIVGREDVRKWKPDPEGLIKIQQYFGVEKEEVIFIGDLENDLLTGQNAGVDACLVDDLIKIVKEFRT